MATARAPTPSDRWPRAQVRSRASRPSAARRALAPPEACRLRQLAGRLPRARLGVERRLVAALPLVQQRPAAAQRVGPERPAAPPRVDPARAQQAPLAPHGAADVA